MIYVPKILCVQEYENTPEVIFDPFQRDSMKSSSRAALWSQSSNINLTCDLLEMQIHGPYPRPTESETLFVGPVLTNVLCDSGLCQS